MSEQKLQEKSNSNYVFYWMCWRNSFGETKRMLVEERKLAIYVEIYNSEGKEVWFEDEST